MTEMSQLGCSGLRSSIIELQFLGHMLQGTSTCGRAGLSIGINGAGLFWEA